MSGRRTIAAGLGATVAVGIASGVAWAAFSSTTTNGPNSFTAKTDLRPPVAGATIGARSDGGGTAGQIRQGVGYYIYANVSDVGNPASGVQTVTANLSTFDTGVTAAALTTTGGPWTVGGTSYTRRSALLTANTPLTTGSTYSYSLTMADVAGNSTTSSGFTVTIETYSTVINATSGLVSYWRLGESDTGSTTTVVNDTFTGVTGTLLQVHIGETGAIWTRYASSQTGNDGMITSAGRLRRDLDLATMYYASGVPSSPDYSVEADVYVASLLTNDAASVIGRASTSADTYYRARYIKIGVTTASWDLAKVVSGTETSLGSYNQTLSAGATYTLTLDMDASTIRLLVNGTQRISATDTAIATAGRGGVRLGYGGSSLQGDATGLHLDDFTVTVPVQPVADDSKGANDGSFMNGVAHGAAGALAGDTNTAALFDGVNDYVTIPDAASLDLGDGPITLEAWIKRSNQDAGGLSLFQKGANGYQFGLYLNELFFAKDNVATFAESTTTIDTSWRYVVATKSGSSFKVYIDGVDRTLTLTNQTLVNTASALVLGAKSGTAEFLGATIDEAAIYNTVLSAATVADHYQSGKGS